MKIPSVVNILHKHYEVEECDCLIDGEDVLYGRIHFLQEKILINSESCCDQKRASLLHEIIHGLNEVYCIELEEKQVAKLGNALYALIKDNPCLFQD